MFQISRAEPDIIMVNLILSVNDLFLYPLLLVNDLMSSWGLQGRWYYKAPALQWPNPIIYPTPHFTITCDGASVMA